MNGRSSSSLVCDWLARRKGCLALATFPTKKVGQKIARFRQIKMDQPTVHHDALEFASGQLVLLTSLCPGQNATVLQMPVGAHAPTEAGEQSPVTTNETERRDAFID
jgi:hypothetical protein